MLTCKFIYRSVLLLVPAIAFSPAGLTAARAESSLRGDLAILAKDIKTILKKRGEKAVSIGQITGPPTLPSSGGPGIARILQEELRKLGIKVKPQAKIGIEGKYRDVKVKETGLMAAQLTVNVLDRRGNQLLQKNRRSIGIFKMSEIAALLGLTVQLDLHQNEKNRNQQLVDSLDNPKVSLGDAGQISAQDNSPYAIEILVGPSPEGPFQVRKPTNQDGLAFVPIKRGEFYRVRLLNDSPQEAAVAVSIDGISMFAFSKVRPNGKPYTQLLVDAGKKATIKGWHITNEESDSFEVTEYAKSAAAELKSEAKTGTITVCFAAAWPKTEQPPEDEPEQASARGFVSDATGRGPRVGAKFREVERKFGHIRAMISVRYTK